MVLLLLVCYLTEFSLESATVLEILVHPEKTVLHSPTELVLVNLEDRNKTGMQQRSLIKQKLSYLHNH